MKRGISKQYKASAATERGRKAPCTNHPDRVPAMKRGDMPLCWECILGTEKFLKEYPPGFYEYGGPGFLYK